MFLLVLTFFKITYIRSYFKITNFCDSNYQFELLSLNNLDIFVHFNNLNIFIHF
jgi:hypothetical protein